MLLAGWSGCQKAEPEKTEESKAQSELIAMQGDYVVANFTDYGAYTLKLKDKDGNVKDITLKKDEVASVKSEDNRITIVFKDGSQATFRLDAYINVTLSENKVSLAKKDSAVITFTVKANNFENVGAKDYESENVKVTVEFNEEKNGGTLTFLGKGIASFKEDITIQFYKNGASVDVKIPISRLHFGFADGQDSMTYYTVGDGENGDFELLGGIRYEVETDADWIGVIDAREDCLKLRFLENAGGKRESEVRLRSEDGNIITISVVQTMSQRAVLMKLYEATNGDNWRENSNWCSDRSLNEWFGIKVSNGHVWEIDLTGNHLDGYLPDEIYELPFLETLKIGSLKHSNTLDDSNKDDWNIIRGEISPKIGQLTHLRILDFQGLINITCGDIPDELWMPQIEKINLNKVSVKGRLSSAIGNATNLKYLDISNNYGKTDLRGILPLEIAKLKKLEFLNLEGNKHLTGTLPENIGDMESLQRIDIGICALTGTIPESIFKLKNLYGFTACDNFLEGTFDLNRLAELPNMNFFDISSNNHLIGIGEEIPDNIYFVKFDNQDGMRIAYGYGEIEYAYESIFNTSEMLAERLAEE